MSGNLFTGPGGRFTAHAALTGTGTQRMLGSGAMTAHASLSSSGGMLGLLGSGALHASAALTGSGTVTAGTFSLFYPNTAGPTNGGSFNNIAAWCLQFEVTASGHELVGYGVWICPGTPTGPTAPCNCYLYHWSGSAWVLDSGASVTSGTLSTGWNAVNLSTPFSLTASLNYMAVLEINGHPAVLNNQFGSGDPYAAGFTNGPLFIYSDTTGSAPAPSGYPQGNLCTTINLPSVPPCSTGSNSGWFGCDVIVQ